MAKTVDGYEMTWSVNVQAPFLLTSLLLDLVSDRIINVSSISAGSSIDFSNLQQVGLPTEVFHATGIKAQSVSLQCASIGGLAPGICAEWPATGPYRSDAMEPSRKHQPHWVTIIAAIMYCK